jgi:hypothetical protein
MVSLLFERLPDIDTRHATLRHVDFDLPYLQVIFGISCSEMASQLAILEIAEAFVDSSLFPPVCTLRDVDSVCVSAGSLAAVSTWTLDALCSTLMPKPGFFIDPLVP